MPFDMKVSRGGSVGSGMSDMLADALVNSNRFIVLERQHVQEVMAEQDFGRSGRVKRETAPQIGEIEGAQLLIRGAVTTFEPECSGGTLTVVGIKQACVAINMRIIDAKTGRVLNATTVDGSALTAGIGLTASLPMTPLPLGLGGWSKTPMERDPQLHRFRRAAHREDELLRSSQRREIRRAARPSGVRIPRPPPFTSTPARQWHSSTLAFSPIGVGKRSWLR